MVSTYYTIKFSDLDGYYDGESQFDTYEQAKQAFDELVKEDEQYGVYEYSMMELLKCGNGEEPDCMDEYWFEGNLPEEEEEN